MNYAFIQMKVEGGKKQRNMARALRMIDEAVRHQADLILLPEAMDLGWTHPSARHEAEPIPLGYPALTLCEAARRHQVFICAGLTEREGNAIYNSAVLIDPQGEILLKHRKIHELDSAHDLYGLGQRLEVVQTPLGAIGLMICADAFAEGQVIARTLGYMGADILLSPCAWAVPAGHDNLQDPYGDLWRANYKPVARDFKIWIAGVSNVGWITGGPWQGRPCIGCSLLIDPEGREVWQGPYGPEAETIYYAEITPCARPARGTQWSERWRRAER